MKRNRRTTKPTQGGKGWILAVALIVASALAYSTAGYLPFISDDALISLRYADRLLDGEGLTWTDGERVEGYSNLLWILINAALGLVGFDLIVATRVLGYVGFLAVFAAILCRHRPRDSTSALPALTAGLALTLCGPVAVWTVGGLEQPLLVGLLAWALVRCFPLVDPSETPSDHAWRLPSVLLALICWTRPDGIVLAAAVACGVIVARPRLDGFRTSIRLISLPLVAVVLQTGFRLAYYGDWIPNSARAKVAFTGLRLTEGLQYIGQGLWAMVGLALPAAVLAVLALRHAERGPRTRFLLVPLSVWALYVAMVGGDSFPAYRQLLPVVIILAFLLADGIAALLERGGSRRGVAWGLSLASLVVLGVMQHSDAQNLRARQERWEWDGEVIGRLLREGFPDRPLMAVDPAGTLPYFSRLPSIDMLGINDRYLATHRPTDFGQGALGHELGDGAYVLSREPDLVLFCGPAGGARACFRSGHEMLEDPTFSNRYRLVTFEGRFPRTFRSQVWVRSEGGRTGIRRDPGRVTVPAYLLTAIPQVARLDPLGKLAVAVSGNTAAGLGGLTLEPGLWRLELDSNGPGVRVMVRLSGIEKMLGGGIDSLTFRLPDDSISPIDVLVTPDGPDAETFVRQLNFTLLDSD